jgi:hypothetical protein
LKASLESIWNVISNPHCEACFWIPKGEYIQRMFVTLGICIGLMLRVSRIMILQAIRKPATTNAVRCKCDSVPY